MIETDIDILCPAQSSVAIDNPSIDEEIKDLTFLVRDYQEKLLSTLNARASLLLKAQRLELALDDAIAMMDIAPYSPLGYLCAGEIDSLRGHHALAIKMYEDGLERVPRSHPHYQQLVKARAAAYDKKNKRIDFISTLPLDVVTHNIIPRILQHQTIIEIGKPCVYFDVCQTWRQRTALADVLQYVIGPEELFEDDYERVQDLAPFMRSLIVEQPKREILSKITKQHHIRSSMLKNLRIIESSERTPTLLLSSLRPLSNTLTDLRIENGHCKLPKKRYRLCDILEACPNLSSIRLDDADIDMSSVTETYPKLVKLQLVNMASDVKRGDILSLLQPFPQLRVLKIIPVFESDILKVVDQHCPLLQQLILTGESPDAFDVVDTPEKTGLRVLSVPTGRHDSIFKEDDLVQYLMKHSETLEAFAVISMAGFDQPKTLLQQTASQQVTFKRLR